MRRKIFSAIFFSAAVVWALATLVVIALSGDLKLSKEALYTIVIASIVGILLVAVIAVIASKWIADSISGELNKIDWDKPEDSNASPEFLPLIEQITKKNEQIASQMSELKREHENRDRMRREFTANVSHELKTPIALIQGYSEGLLENVNSDPESRKFYAEVILDETNKMDKNNYLEERLARATQIRNQIEN